MSDKPQIYAHCPAGCSWETVHKADLVDGTLTPLAATGVRNQKDSTIIKKWVGTVAEYNAAVEDGFDFTNTEVVKTDEDAINTITAVINDNVITTFTIPTGCDYTKAHINVTYNTSDQYNSLFSIEVLDYVYTMYIEDPNNDYDATPYYYFSNGHELIRLYSLGGNLFAQNAVYKEPQEVLYGGDLQVNNGENTVSCTLDKSVSAGDVLEITIEPDGYNAGHYVNLKITVPDYTSTETGIDPTVAMAEIFSYANNLYVPWIQVTASNVISFRKMQSFDIATGTFWQYDLCYKVTKIVRK